MVGGGCVGVGGSLGKFEILGSVSIGEGFENYYYFFFGGFEFDG